MKVIADLHIHSKYSRAVSKQMDLETMALWAEKKGIDLLATGDWTHPVWFKEIESKLEEDGEGIFKVKSSKSKMRYALSCEISNIYTKGGKGRRIHTVFMAPSFKTVRKINKELTKRGGNLLSDGRPILGFSMEEMCEIVWGIDEKVIVMPAHIWTPWFAMFGSKSGFDSVEECFGKYADKIKAIETGLSSDPAMNWKVKDLETRAIVSSSDAHSPRKLGREVTVFDFEKDKYSFSDLAEGLEKGNKKNKIVYTIEFHPEEGKYYYTGHRKCGVVQSPKETSKRGTTCHVCGKPLTVGVMHRVEELASGPSTNLSSQNFNKETPSSLPAQAGFAVPTRHSAGSPVKESPLTSRKGLNLTEFGKLKWHYHPTDKSRPPYVMLVPLQEIISEAVDVGVASKKVQGIYEDMIIKLGNEFDILMKVKINEVEKVAGERVAEALRKVRIGDIVIQPGYDGEFGVVKIWSSDVDTVKKKVNIVDQKTLF